MKLKLFFIFFALSISALLGLNVFSSIDIIEIGSKIPEPDMQMRDISDELFSLQELNKENGLLVVFSCNTCPFVNAWEDRYKTISQLCKVKNVGMAAINSNAARRDGVDSMDEMIKHAKEKGYEFRYLLDENANLALLFGATKTPQIFLFNKDLKLVYTGAIDDNLKNAEKVKNHYLVNAINNLVDMKKIDPSITEALGCSIKKVAAKK
ncbi:MAG TPA: thioredoxin family protein [Flavobacteriales bacterium]|nr:thioredoxin family protein [Flavobacteriales bacterium]